MWELTEQYLPIPANSALSEKAFSSSGNVVTMRRCRLKHTLVDDIVLLRENMHILDEMLENNLIS